MQQGQSLATQLGLTHEDIMDVKSVDQPIVVAIFELLWQWRGKVPEPDKIDQLIKALKETKQKDTADIVARVSKEKRSLRRSDFQ